VKRGWKIFFAFLFGVILILILKHELVYYGYIQAKGQINIIRKAQPVEAILTDPDFPDSLKIKLKLIDEVKMFAVNHLGLKGIDNYTTYYDQEGKELMWVVSGCQPFKLESYEWGFPILGTFSYKGFFRYEMAVREMDKLKRMGLDASIRTAGGWSTLGILKDPVLSKMLERNVGSLTDLIIHELTHGTIFIKDSIELNENLASFIGNTGAKHFLLQRFGETSEELLSFNRRIEDHQKFTKYVLQGASKLDSLYASFTENMSHEEKSELKIAALGEFVENIKNIRFYNKGYNMYFNDFTPDNTFFMSYLRYRGGQDFFIEEFIRDFNGDLPAYIEALKGRYVR
jgi:predicted aminopeptidase